MSRPPVFLDRDGTIVRDPGYLRRVSDVALLPGSGPAVRRLNASGSPVIVVTNQSGIGRGYLAEEDFRAVQAEIERQLAASGARLNAVYFCPHDPTLHRCDCRKPGLALYRRAAAELDVTLAGAWFVGDRASDVEPAASLGGRGVLLRRADGSFDDRGAGDWSHAGDLAEAVGTILGVGAVVDPLVVAVLVSGSGSNLQSLIDRFAGDPAVRIGLVVGSRAGIRALERASEAGIPTVVTPPEVAEAGAWLGRTLEESGAGLVILAGYTRLVPSSVVKSWRGRMINVHPALLPAFGGAGMYGRRVHESVLEAGVRVTGVTVHLVDETYDTGAIIAQESVAVHEDDDADTLAARVLQSEHRLLPAVVAAVADGTCVLRSDGVRWLKPLRRQVPGTKES